jgi:hypothetical protein
MEEVDTGWEDLRREARKLEGDLDVKLSSYAKLGGMLAHGGKQILCRTNQPLVLLFQHMFYHVSFYISQ